MHFGVILPNFGRESSPARIRAYALAAEELGFDWVWVTEHIVVGPEGVNCALWSGNPSFQGRYWS